MNNNLTEIVCILDKSGSMSHLVNDTIGGYNTFIEEQKKLPGEATVTLVLFNTDYHLVENGKNIKDIEKMTDKIYSPGGSTALLDAIGKSINDVGARLNLMAEKDRPSKVIFLIITDGEENSSREFTKVKIKEMIEHQKNKYSWEFVFMGANIDSFAVGSSFGINPNNIQNYAATSVGTRSAYASFSAVTASYRSGQKPDFPVDKDAEPSTATPSIP